MTHPFLALTEDDREEMLRTIGVSSVEELFRDIPAGVRFGRALDLEPALSEHELSAHLSELAAQNVDTTRELLSSALEANLSLIAIGQNEVAKKLAGWAAILAVPTMVAGIYGMNFHYMPELDWRYGYPLVLGATAAICGGLWLRFRRAGWL